jgi:hypothetical protein
VRRSNQASVKSAVPAAAANSGRRAERRSSAISVADSEAISKASKPTQAMSQWCASCLAGSVALR